LPKAAPDAAAWWRQPVAELARELDIAAPDYLRQPRGGVFRAMAPRAARAAGTAGRFAVPRPLSQPARADQRTCAALRARAKPARDRIRGPLDEAILHHPGEEPDPWTKIDEVPFDFERQRAAVIVDTPERGN